MAARKVTFEQGEYYHFYNRGSGRQSIFREPDNYLFVLEKVKKYIQLLNITMIAYCLMPNHYHFLVRQNGIIPARLLVQRVFNSYSKAFNKKYERTGTLFEGRYKVDPIETEEHLLHLCCYIHANPVKDGFVKSLDEWAYSNYFEWIGTRQGTLVDSAFVKSYFPKKGSYEAYVADYLDYLAKLG